MLCIQGSYALLPNKMIVHQTIGQQSISGNYRKSDLVINQGYQQSTYRLQYSISIPKDIITTKIYPNPVSDVINFEFSSAIRGVIKVIIFDLLGKVVFYQEKMAISNVLTIDNIYISEGKYLVKLTSENYNYSTKILKLK
jgi:hypothetical protein